MVEKKRLIMLFKNKILQFLFPIPSIVILVLLGIILAVSTTEAGPMTFGYWIIYMIIVFLFFVVPFDIVWFVVKTILNNKKQKENAKLHSAQLLDRARVLAEIINTTTDEDQFFHSYAEITKIFEVLCSYEKYRFFKGELPSKNLDDIRQKKDIATLEFRERQEKYKSENERTTFWESTILRVDNMEGHDFEYFCADLLRKNGFVNVEVTQGSGDHGIDILAEKDDITYAIQCKCYSSNIGNAAVQQAHTGKSLYHKDVAVVMTNQYFTQQAKDEAAQLGVKLWDRNRVNELIEKSML